MNTDIRQMLAKSYENKQQQTTLATEIRTDENNNKIRRGRKSFFKALSCEFVWKAWQNETQMKNYVSAVTQLSR